MLLSKWNRVMFGFSSFFYVATNLLNNMVRKSLSVGFVVKELHGWLV